MADDARERRTHLWVARFNALAAAALMGIALTGLFLPRQNHVVYSQVFLFGMSWSASQYAGARAVTADPDAEHLTMSIITTNLIVVIFNMYLSLSDTRFWLNSVAAMVASVEFLLVFSWFLLEYKNNRAHHADLDACILVLMLVFVADLPWLQNGGVNHALVLVMFLAGRMYHLITARGPYGAWWLAAIIVGWALVLAQGIYKLLQNTSDDVGEVIYAVVGMLGSMVFLFAGAISSRPVKVA